MRLADGARVAVIGAGPAGLVSAKNALEVGFDVTVFESSDRLGGQWHSTGSHSGVWPGMRTNTSRAMTAFSDFPVPADHGLHPLAEQIQSYLQGYADEYGISSRIRFATPVKRIDPAWTVDGERFDAVIAASGRFGNPRFPPGVAGFSGEVIHAFDYPGRGHFADRPTLVYGNGVSGHEIAADLAEDRPVLSAFRKPRFVLPKVVDGVPSDWQWYTQVEALRRRYESTPELERRLRQRVVEVAGHPCDYGAPDPGQDIFKAGLSLSQDYLARVREGRIRCRPAITGFQGRRVTFADGSLETVDALVCATGYEVQLSYLSETITALVGRDLALYSCTFHPDLNGLAVIGMYAVQGPVFPLLELQARWVAGVWSGRIPAPGEAEMRSGLSVGPVPVEAHDTMAVMFSEAAGVAPDPMAHPDLAEALLFGPMVPARYRLDGPGAFVEAPELFADAVTRSRRPPLDLDDLRQLERWGFADLAAVARLSLSPGGVAGASGGGQVPGDHGGAVTAAER